MIGSHTDNPPSTAPATKPGSEAKAGDMPDRFSLPEWNEPVVHPKFQSDLRMASAFDVEVKANGDGRVEGYASTFGGSPDRSNDVVKAGAFRRTLEDHRREKSVPAMLWGHRLEDPVGRWTHLEEDDTGLFVTGQINLKTERGREAFEHVRAGDVNALSIGYVTPEGGRKYLGKGVFSLEDVDLVEISLVTVPANTRARLSAVKQLSSKAEAVDMLRAAGLSKSAATRFAAGGFPALNAETYQAERAKQLASLIEQATLQLRTEQ